MTFAALVTSTDRLVQTHLGETVQYEPGVGAAVSVVGVFSNAYVRADAGGEAVMSSGPAVFLVLADLPSDPEEDAPTITRGGVVYKVREAQKDGDGGVMLLLREA